jgi:uncharacterized protein YdhG (YjbR/CyaY superfamily)
MSGASGDRSAYFPAVEAKYGQPMAVWFARLAELGTSKYDDQIAYLRGTHRFSQAHANAVVMHMRGSTTSKRFATPEDFFATLSTAAASTARAVFDTVRTVHPELELVVAWNQPMLRHPTGYVLGLTASKDHLTLNPLSATVIEALADALSGYAVNKKTIKVPFDWSVDPALLSALVEHRLAELA